MNRNMYNAMIMKVNMNSKFESRDVNSVSTMMTQHKRNMNKRVRQACLMWYHVEATQCRTISCPTQKNSPYHSHPPPKTPMYPKVYTSSSSLTKERKKSKLKNPQQHRSPHQPSHNTIPTPLKPGTPPRPNLAPPLLIKPSTLHELRKRSITRITMMAGGMREARGVEETGGRHEDVYCFCAVEAVGV